MTGIFSNTTRAIRSGVARLVIGAIADGQVLKRVGTEIVGAAAGSSISGLTTGQHVRAASATTIETDGVKRYVATVTQASTAAPVATALENTTGTTLTWARSAQGIYTITAGAAIFAANKTVVITGGNVGTATAAYIVSTTRTSTTVITVNTQAQIADAGTSILSDDLLTETAFEIRIYP